MDPARAPLQMQTAMPLFDNPEFTRWLLGQSVALVLVLVIMSLWNWTLSRENRDLRKRNEKLSDDLVRAIEVDTHERSQRETDAVLRMDSLVRNITDSLISGLQQRRKSWVERSEKS